MTTAYIENNQELWNDWTTLHVTESADYTEQIQAVKAGKSTLRDIECEELGDVA